ncbi:hypothetical protein EUX98_g8118 [Antrodiella citrinella]|uniref:DUF6533 domain-containing protein n=1 Tax=Antrodiella citrinella TaxID=2447956 RepID=A0A4S4MCC5_9APHY|nr:hypothetical protein EUX98_g8118 [Antrodiella citrinella]
MSALDIPLIMSPETVASHGAMVQIMTLIGFVALVYDHILTFADEVNYIWEARAGLVSTLFLLNRYIVPLVLVVDLYEMFGLANDSGKFCKVWTALQSFLTVASFLSIHSIVAMRVHALYSGTRWIKVFLWTVGTLYAASSITIIIVAGVRVIPHIEPPHHGCVGAIPSYLWTAWLPSIIFETILFGLTVNAMLIQDRRRSFNTLTLILYRDGIFFFVAVAFCSLFSLLVWALADPTLLGLARYFALAMVNVAASRLVLNLKAYAGHKRNPSTVWHVTAPAPPVDRAPQAPSPGFEFVSTNTSAFDLEMYDIERSCQQLGTRLH